MKLYADGWRADRFAHTANGDYMGLERQPAIKARTTASICCRPTSDTPFSGEVIVSILDDARAQIDFFSKSRRSMRETLL